MKTTASSALLDKARESGLADGLFRDVAALVAAKKRKQRVIRRSTASLVLLTIFLAWAIPTYRSTATLTTGPGQRTTVTLPDGTSVDLSASTELQTDFRYFRRVVRLAQGEAFFSVAKDPRHPFFVETATGTVHVTGTQFNVRLPTASHAEVTLLEGSVRLEDTGFADTTLKPGEHATLDTTAPQVRTLSPDELSNLTVWRKGLLVLDGLTLGEVAQRFSSYHGISIAVDRDVASLRPAGVCALDELPQLIEILEASRSVRVIAGPGGTYRITRR